jgi:dipeptidyl aminopeptidase/acylaminoacyl peptidase
LYAVGFLRDSDIFNIAEKIEEERIMQQHNYSSDHFQLEINQFKVSGELILPPGERTFPLIIYVWGSGPTNYKKTKSSNTFKLFLESGYAVLLYDKPGSGKSTGKFTPKKLIKERTLIARKIIEKVTQNQQIDANKIGLFGSSQAGYIIPSIIETTPYISFAISWSSPMENGIL